MKNYNVSFSPSFINMFKDVLIKCIDFNYIYALKIEKRVYKDIALLKIFPYATPTIKFRGDPEIYRKFIVAKRFLIIFQIFDDTIQLQYFIDGRQNPKNYFKLYKK